MAASKKKLPIESDTHETLSPAPGRDQAETAPSLEDVSQDMRADAPDSPARALQAKLEESINEEKPAKPLYDTGRILASASGITAILGVFFFSGIW